MTSYRQQNGLPSAPASDRPLLGPPASLTAPASLHRTWQVWAVVLLFSVLLAGCSSIGKREGGGPNPYSHAQRKSESSSGLFSLFHKEPDPPKSIDEWMRLKRLDP
jgi:hypothetical protein